jgi:hypothetical protein
VKQRPKPPKLAQVSKQTRPAEVPEPVKRPPELPKPAPESSKPPPKGAPDRGKPPAESPPNRKWKSRWR